MTDRTMEQQAQPDGFESPKDLFEQYAQISRIRKFWRTRKAVLSEEPLYDYRRSELEMQNFMGAWTFNFAQSSLSAVPAAVLLGLAHLVQKIIGIRMNRTFELDQSLTAFSVPFILMVSAFIVARATLFRTDSTKKSRSVAVRAYLYLDGAYGFYPQMFVSLYVIANSILTPIFYYLSEKEGKSGFEIALVVTVYGAMLAGAVGAMWQLIVQMKTIPAELFRALGYRRVDEAMNSRIAVFAPDSKPHAEMELVHQYPPVWKYRLAVAIVLPAVSYAFLLLIAFISPVVAMFR